MLKRLMCLLLVVMVSACGTIATPSWTPTAAPTPTATPIVPIDPNAAAIGRWQWQRFTTAVQEYPPVQLWFDLSEGGEVSGVLSIYPNASDIPAQALTLVQQNGCNIEFDGLALPSVVGVFATTTQAFVQVEVTECTIKYFGPYQLAQPISGQFVVAYDEALTQLILNPAEPTPLERGRRVFAQYCSGCHGSYAEGMPGIPALNTDQVRGYSDEQLLTIVSQGVVNTTMPAWGVVLRPDDLDGVLAFIRNLTVIDG